MEDTAKTLSGLTDAPVNYESAANRFINPQKGDKQLSATVLSICQELLLSN